ncbi:MAG TPA: chaperonin GroEL [Anaerohalosphaeraceae bacterium]|nr:chaperonin GroEL [Phycisphaerae bacterium]HOL30397.1 chaperonin GroEL [Anaerohalosphaeraceae bacterium]HOM76749.1 chaperonin GroEL [Anaerohalosphaeraceae bacterium]HPC65014.1 chaperonin GroEL [Anaerohalosphaeraceae bacterium]HPO69681.1 chaperonin GroEL [Anaerohalosphaeraceae bacterium]
MAVKDLAFNSEARNALLAGVEKLAAAVKSTLGPRGRCAIIDKGWGGPTVTKDGVTVAEEIELVDKAENMGAKLVREAASKTSKVAGDGTTTATVLAEALFREAFKNLAAGADAMSLNRGIQKAVAAAVDQLAKLAKPIDIAKKDDIVNIAAISANNDVEIGKKMAEAFMRVGKDGVITIEEGKSLETTVEYVEGMQFDRGYLSPHFVTDADHMTCELNKPYILVYEDKISNVQKIVPLLEAVAKSKRPLLIIAEDVEGEALATLVVNKLRGILQVAAVKAPGYGDRRKAMLEDIAILTGAQPIFKDLGIELDKVTLSQLGQAKKITIDSDNTIIVEGAGSSEAIKGRIAQIRSEIETTTSDYDREKLQERLAKLTGGVAQINVGAGSEAEMKEKKARIEDALHATRAAIEEGIVPGGGVALIRCIEAVKKLKLEGDEQTGANIVANALKMPCYYIAENAGAVGTLVVNKVAQGKGGFGYNADKDIYEDLLEAGVIDPHKVTRIALQNAASVAGLLLTTDCIVTEKPKDKEPAGAGRHGGMGGMGGMDDMDMM